MNRSLGLTPELSSYILSVGVREAPALARLRLETVGLRGAGMQIAPEQGAFMQLLVELTGTRRYLEIGTYTGYSALAVALALPDDGRVLACDVSEEWTAVARRHWQAAGVAEKIELRLAPALETLDRLLAEGAACGFDFVFIDADKANYGAYCARALELVRRGGLIAIDNVLWGGKVADPLAEDADTKAIREVNRQLAQDPRVSISLVPIGDGLMLARKR